MTMTISRIVNVKFHECFAEWIYCGCGILAFYEPFDADSIVLQYAMITTA